jgi:hypothetical protein
MLRFRLDSALRRRLGAKSGGQVNAICEVCRSVIPIYVGPLSGVICDSCYRPNRTRQSSPNLTLDRLAP